MNREHPDRPSVPKVATALARAAITSLRAHYDTITPAELVALLGSDEEVTVIDVRTAQDYAVGHIDGAVNLPFTDLDDLAGAVPHGGPVVAVCYLGMLSRTAAQRLVADGHQPVFNLDGGMKAWRGQAGGTVGGEAGVDPLTPGDDGADLTGPDTTTA